MWQGEFAIDGRVIGFEALVDPKPISELLDVKGELMFRTVYPTVAQEQSCVWHFARKPDHCLVRLDEPRGLVIGLLPAVWPTSN
jgi:hypothetical protein